VKLTCIVATALAALTSTAAFAELPHIKNLTINPTPPGAKVGAAFFNVHNPNDTAITLSKVSSPVISRVEMHLSTVVDDIAKMRKLDAVEIDANETFSFTHGGHHIMLMDLERWTTARWIMEKQNMTLWSTKPQSTTIEKPKKT